MPIIKSQRQCFDLTLLTCTNKKLSIDAKASNCAAITGFDNGVCSVVYFDGNDGNKMSINLEPSNRCRY